MAGNAAAAAEKAATIATPLAKNGFNPKAVLPYGCTVRAIGAAMREFLDFLTLINSQLHKNQLPRLESMFMPANFSSIVGEFMGAGIPKHCRSLVKNNYHNGHPDLIPANTFLKDAVQHDHRGIEIKAFRYLKGCQGHNPEDIFLLVFVFRSSRPNDSSKEVAPIPFGFIEALGAELQKSDWLFAGRSPTSRRTITASVMNTGYAKMKANWIYRDASLSKTALPGDEPELAAIVEQVVDQAEDV
jgi:hypothetical protein